MYKYKIGFSSYEESASIELEHEKLFTHEEITKMIGEGIIELMPIWKATSRGVHNFEDCFWGTPPLEDWLIHNKGFKPIEYNVNWCIFGWASIFHKDDWKTDRTDETELNTIVDMMNAAGYTKADDWMEHE